MSMQVASRFVDVRFIAIAMTFVAGGCVSTQFGSTHAESCEAFATVAPKVQLSDGETTTEFELDATRGVVTGAHRNTAGSFDGLGRQNVRGGETPKDAEAFGLPKNVIPNRWFARPLARFGDGPSKIAITAYDDRSSRTKSPKQSIAIVDLKSGALVSEVMARSHVLSLDWDPSGTSLVVLSQTEPTDPPGWWTKLDRLAPHGVEIYDVWAQVFRSDGTKACEMQVAKNMKWAIGYVAWRTE